MAARQLLADKVLAALADAIAEDRLDVAEHLVCALETLELDPRPGSALGEAYLMIAGALEDRKCRRRTS